MRNPISDLHVHCGLKGYASDEYPGFENHTIWDFYEARKDELEKLNFVLKGAIKGTAKASQANLDACVEANLCAPFIAIYPIERQMFDFNPLKPYRNLFKLLLAGKQHAYLGSAVSGFPLERVEKIIARATNERNEGIDYYREFVKERSYLLRQRATSSKNHPDYRYVVASNYQEFEQSLEDQKTIAALFTAEGAHSFGHYLFNTTFRKEYEELELQERMVLKTSMLKNLTEVKTEDDGMHAPFFVTFCHHFNNLLAGHARSFTGRSPLALGVKKPGLRDLFNQEVGLNRGFTALGEQVVDLMLDRKKGRRILIDCKHMSVQSRKEYYALVRQKREEENDQVPIIHSHAAINGWLTLDQANTMDEHHTIDKGHFFSRWRINLTNEDILETFDSDGLIGVVLHEGRMPGDGFKKAAKKLKKKVDKARAGSEKKARAQRALLDMYLQLIWSNIFHIIKVVKENRLDPNNVADAWKMIALGSDYDGLVDPMDSFPEVTTFKTLKEEMVDYLNNGKPINFSQGGEAKPIPPAEIEALCFGQTAAEILDRVLFENTRHFMSKYFTEAYLGKESATELPIAEAA